MSIVFITGASSGFGKASAIKFAEAGYHLLLNARRTDRLDALKNELESNYHTKVCTIPFDVRDNEAVTAAFNSLPDAWKTIDILINNAGLAVGRDAFQDGNLADWETMIDTNIKGFLAVLRIVSKQMVKQKSGHIINIGSVAGVESYAKGGVYCATKHAVHAISQSLREEMVEHGVKVSEILPGAVNTEFSKVRFHGDDERAQSVYQGFEPLVAEDIAELIVYNANLPYRVNLAECLVLAGAQSRATKIHRQI